MFRVMCMVGVVGRCVIVLVVFVSHSVCDVTGKSSYPTRTEGSWSGFYSREAARSSTNNQNGNFIILLKSTQIPTL